MSMMRIVEDDEARTLIPVLPQRLHALVVGGVAFPAGLMVLFSQP